MLLLERRDTLCVRRDRCSLYVRPPFAPWPPFSFESGTMPTNPSRLSYKYSTVCKADASVEEIDSSSPALVGCGLCGGGTRCRDDYEALSGNAM